MRSSDFTRSDRLSDQIRTEISTILRDDVKDPRLKGITIIKVELSKDISKAYIFFSSLNSFSEINFQEVDEALKKAKGFIRSTLGKKLNVKRLPELAFQKDDINHNSMNGFLLIDKPSGITSAECVSRIKKILNEKKVGHCGTLDPLATGMLPICNWRSY